MRLANGVLALNMPALWLVQRATSAISLKRALTNPLEATPRLGFQIFLNQQPSNPPCT